MKSHSISKKHQKHLKAWKESMRTQQRFEDAVANDYDEHGVEMRLSPEVLVYRQSAIVAIARVNISFKSFEEMRLWIDYHSKDGLSLGHYLNLSRCHAEQVHQIQIDQIRKLLHNYCFPEYTTIFDGTPAFANFEVIMLRVVTNDYRILQLFFRVGAFEKSLKYDEIALDTCAR